MEKRWRREETLQTNMMSDDKRKYGGELDGKEGGWGREGEGTVGVGGHEVAALDDADLDGRGDEHLVRGGGRVRTRERDLRPLLAEPRFPCFLTKRPSPWCRFLGAKY